MNRTMACLGGLITLSVVVLIPGTMKAQENQCADRARQGIAVNLARRINTVEISSRARVGAYQPMTAFAEISIPPGFTAQLVTNADGSQYVFSVKDTQDPCHFAVFSDQEQVIYTAQPLQ